MCDVDHAEESHREVYERGQEYHHEAKFSHEAIAGAASFAGMKAWEDHQRKEGMLIIHYTLLNIFMRLAPLTDSSLQASL
jgi:hypothetical protein